MKAKEIVEFLQGLGDREHAAGAARFFKTRPGEYGHGDIFLGIPVPRLRRAVKEFASLNRTETIRLLRSRYHEARFLALLILVDQYQRSGAAGREQVCGLYLDHTRYVNNWDLVDATADKILGPHLEGRDRSLLRGLARSEEIWERRIAMVATYHFIKQGEFAPTLELAEMLLDDREDLIHKACGWMLREVGKRDQARLEAFLRAHYDRLPRTTLRYAIERMNPARRRRWLQGP